MPGLKKKKKEAEAEVFRPFGCTTLRFRKGSASSSCWKCGVAFRLTSQICPSAKPLIGEMQRKLSGE